MSFFMLVGVFGIAAASFDYEGRPTLKDLSEFYNPRDTIYVWIRSFKFTDGDNHYPICVSTQVKSLQDKVMKFQEAYLLGTRIFYYRVTVELTEGKGRDAAPVMEATQEKHVWSTFSIPGREEGSQTEPRTEKRVYNFQFFDKNKGCAVVTFSDGVTRCQLLFWETKNNLITPVNRRGLPPSRSGFDNCEREYNSLCPNATRYDIYENDCRGMFPKRLKKLNWPPEQRTE
uniref:Lipocalin n=1 Tax=Rhipicephalus appendiculatus TaxID=34631 RepID=A0A131Z6I5_RHIAP